MNQPTINCIASASFNEKQTPVDPSQSSQNDISHDVDLSIDVNSGTVFECPAQEDWPYKPPLNKKSSWVVTAVLQIVTAVGVGIFSLSIALNQLGGVLGLVLLVVMAPISLYSAILISKAHALVPSATSYLHMANLASASRAWKNFVTVACILAVAMMNASYLLGIVEALGSLTVGWFSLCKPVWGVIAVVILLPAIWIRSLRKLRLLFIFDSILYTVALLLPTIYMLVYMDTRNIETETVNSQMTWYMFFNSLSMIVFAYSSAYSYIEIISEMEQPEYFPRCLFISGSYQTFFYCIYAGTNYYYFGTTVPTSFMDAIPNFEIPYRISTMLIVIHMYASYLSRSVMLTKNLHLTIWPDSATQNTLDSRIRSFVIAIGILLFSFFISMVVPRFQQMISLTGSVVTPWVGFVIPAAFLMEAHRVAKKQISQFYVGICFAYACFGIVLFFAGTAANIISIVDFNSTDATPTPFGCPVNSIY